MQYLFSSLLLQRQKFQFQLQQRLALQWLPSQKILREIIGLGLSVDSMQLLALPHALLHTVECLLLCFGVENKEICLRSKSPKFTKIPVIFNFSKTIEKAISINAAYHDDLIGDSNSAWFLRAYCRFKISLAISWFAKFPTPGTEMDKIVSLGDKLTVKNSSDDHDVR